MTSRFLTALTCSVALALAACGGDDDDDGAIEAEGAADTAQDAPESGVEDEVDFCTLLIENNDAPLSEFPNFAERIKAVAPPEIADDVAVSIDGFLAYTAVDLTEASPAVIAEAEAQLEASLAASEQVEVWVATNCDALPPGFFS